MKWMLIVAVFGTQPVKTGLLFDSLSDCLKAEEAMREEMSTAYKAWEKWAYDGESEGLSRYGSDRAATRAYHQKRIINQGTCVPHVDQKS